ncbi:hypothetical protein AAZX31_03G052100 [Glycine max]
MDGFKHLDLQQVTYSTVMVLEDSHKRITFFLSRL